MKKVSFKTNYYISKFGTSLRHSKKDKTDSFGVSVGPFKTWLRSQHPAKLAGIAVGSFGVGFGIYCLIINMLNKSNSEIHKKEHTHITDDEIRKTEAKCMSEAKKYDMQVESDIKMLKARHDLREANIEELPEELEQTLAEGAVLSSECKVPDLLKKQQNAPVVPDLINGIIRPGDIHILAGQSGLGKSFYALAFAFKFSSGKPSTIIPSDVECKPMKVFYYDGELADEEFTRRCKGNSPDAYSNIVRIGHPNFKSIDAFMDDVEQKVLNEPSDVVVIGDNMDSMFEDLNKKSASQLRNRIVSIQAEFQFRLTFVFVGHPTKDYDEFAKMELKHIAGSSSFTNMASSISIIAPTRFGEGFSMLRILKYRNGKNNSEKVFVARMVDDPYPHPVFERVDLLKNALPVRTKASKESHTIGNEVEDGQVGSKGKYTTEEEQDAARMYEETQGKDGKYSSRKASEAFKKKYGKTMTPPTVISKFNKYRAEKEIQDPNLQQ